MGAIKAYRPVKDKDGKRLDRDDARSGTIPATAAPPTTTSAPAHIAAIPDGETRRVEEESPAMRALLLPVEHFAEGCRQNHPPPEMKSPTGFPAGLLDTESFDSLL
jgi:hypothetical protein